MKPTFLNRNFSARVRILCVMTTWACLSASGVFAAQASGPKSAPSRIKAPLAGTQTFDTTQEAVDALIAAAEKFDVIALTEIFGPDGNDIVLSGEFAQDRKHAMDFAAQARKKKVRAR